MLKGLGFGFRVWGSGVRGLGFTGPGKERETLGNTGLPACT